MQINPYLKFNGDCEAAFKFYEQRLGGKIVMMLNHRDAPSAEHVPSDWHNKSCTRASSWATAARS